jgi:hypothetical protein
MFRSFCSLTLLVKKNLCHGCTKNNSSSTANKSNNLPQFMCLSFILSPQLDPRNNFSTLTKSFHSNYSTRPQKQLLSIHTHNNNTNNNSNNDDNNTNRENHHNSCNSSDNTCRELPLPALPLFAASLHCSSQNHSINPFLLKLNTNNSINILSFEGNEENDKSKNSIDCSAQCNAVDNSVTAGRMVELECNGCVYKGSVNSLGLQHGYGEMQYNNGDLYRGKWLLGLQEDTEGQYFYAEQGHYIGGFHQGKRHGFGIYNDCVTGERYEGLWLNNQKQGLGQHLTANNSLLYFGEFAENLYHGQGALYLSDTEMWLGSFQHNSMKQGVRHINVNATAIKQIQETFEPRTGQLIHWRSLHDNISAEKNELNSKQSNFSSQEQLLSLAGEVKQLQQTLSSKLIQLNTLLAIEPNNCFPLPL